GCALMVMPRSRSRSIESSNCSCISRSEIVPVRWSKRSESVVFPWSMWAMMLKLRTCAVSIVQMRDAESESFRQNRPRPNHNFPREHNGVYREGKGNLVQEGKVAANRDSIQCSVK